VSKKFLIFSITLILGCFYSLKPPLPEGIKTIGVESFTNTSERPGIEVSVTQSFIDGIIGDRRIPLKDPDKCDLLIKGEIKRYLRTPLGVMGEGEVYSYKVIINARIKFFKKDGTELFKEKEFSGEAVYDVREKTEDEAINEAAKDLAIKVIQYIYAQTI